MTKKPLQLILVCIVGVVLVAALVFVAIHSKGNEPGGDGPTQVGSPEKPSINRHGRRNVVTDQQLVERGTRTPEYLGVRNEEHTMLLEDLKKLLKTGKDENVSDAFIEANALMDTLERCEFVSAALDLKDQDRSWEAINMLVGYGNPEVIPVLRKALDGPLDADTMNSILDAMMYLGQDEPLALLNDGEADEKLENLRFSLTEEDCNDLATIIETAMAFGDEDVRERSLEAVFCLPVDRQADIYQKALDSDFHDVRLAALNSTSSSPNVDTLMLAIDALDNDDEDVREAGQSNIVTFVDKEFTSREEALAWWERNASRFDDELHFIDPSTDVEQE